MQASPTSANAMRRKFVRFERWIMVASWFSGSAGIATSIAFVAVRRRSCYDRRHNLVDLLHVRRCRVRQNASNASAIAYESTKLPPEQSVVASFAFECRLLALLGSPAMSDFAPLLGDKRTSAAPSPSVPIYEYTA